ncbi:MAG: phenylacetate--CoA ligase family protein [Methylovirgula sp.]
MKLDFSALPLRPNALSQAPMRFCEPNYKNTLSSLMDLVLIETGPRTARENWQAAQLRNLLAHAIQRSPFWRQRLGALLEPAKAPLASLPVLTRADVSRQVTQDGALFATTDGVRVQKHATSGSSGTPVEFFISEMNSVYNNARSFAQYFIDGLDISCNRVRFKTGLVENKAGFTVKHDKGWNNLQGFAKTGTSKFITYTRPDIALLCKELKSAPVGYLVSTPQLVEWLLTQVAPAFLNDIGTQRVTLISGSLDAPTRARLAEVNIPVSTTYSTEEIGKIAHECAKLPGHFHVTTSNVIAEVDMSTPVEVDGIALGRVLVTHLHSYATPFIRYDIGDLARLLPRCPCGHDGPVLTNIYGRSKQLLKHADGRVSPFYVWGRMLLDIVKFNEYRIRQTDLETIVVEIVAPEPLPPEKSEAIRRLVAANAGEDFNVRVDQVERINWGRDIKRLAFRNKLLN